jgi:hypothetical protein
VVKPPHEIIVVVCMEDEIQDFVLIKTTYILMEKPLVENKEITRETIY